MKTRHVYSTPDLEHARSAMQAARGAGIEDDSLSLIAHSDIEHDAIPEEKKEEHTDFAPAAVRGLAQGGGAGVLAGLVALAIPPLGVTIAGAAAAGIAGALVGGWTGALVGAAAPDPVRQQFSAEIEARRILVVLDGDGDLLERADAAVLATGATPLPFEQPTALS